MNCLARDREYDGACGRPDGPHQDQNFWKESEHSWEKGGIITKIKEGTLHGSKCGLRFSHLKPLPLRWKVSVMKS